MARIPLFVLALLVPAATLAGVILDWTQGSGTTWSGWVWSTNVDDFGREGWQRSDRDNYWKQPRVHEASEVTATLNGTNRPPWMTGGSTLYLVPADASKRIQHWFFPNKPPNNFGSSGIADSSSNRFSYWWYLTGLDALDYSNPNPTIEVGTYLCWTGGGPGGENCPSEASGQHYYHQTSMVNDVWVHVEHNQHPTHIRGATGCDNPDNDPAYPSHHYFESMVSWYLDIPYAQSASPSWRVAKPEIRTAADAENETNFGTVWVGYSPGTGKWHMGWDNPYIECGPHTITTDEIRWSTSPITAANFASATIIEPEVNEYGTTNRVRIPTDGTLYRATRFALPAGTESGNSKIYFALKDVSSTGNGDFYTASSPYIRTIDYDLSSAPATYTVTPSAGSGGTISPNTAQTVSGGATAQFTVTANAGFTASVGGTCGGTLVGTTYTTNAITANCTVSATFADTQAPTTPTDLDARSNSTSTVDLSWVASTDAVGVTSYRVEYCSGYGCSSWATLGTPATNAYTHTGITPATNPTIYRYRVYALDAIGNQSGAATSIYFNAQPTIPAFPGAEGGGATSKGGRGGTVYRVTSLLGDTSAGTLRACIAASGPRTCVFAVAGNIELTGNINISLPYITIDGSTAPGDGITISGKGSTQVSLTVRTHNVTIRGIRIRKGYNSGTPDQDGDSVNVLSASATASPVGPVIFDHVSVSWGQDENGGSWALTTRSPKNITYQWSMMYEPLLAHPVNFMTGAYNNATAELMTNIDFHHSFLANSSHRNPLIKNKTFRLVNNLIYNWGDWATAIEGTVQADLIGNKYKTGPLYQTISSKAYEIQLNPTGDASTPISGSPSLYVIGNIGPHNANPLNDNWGMTRLIDIPINAGVELGPLSESYRRLTPLAALPFPITTHDVATAESSVLAGAGASRRLDCAGSWISMRDSADTRVVAEYVAGNAGIIPTNEDAVGGYPTLSAGTACTDTDGDGMPDTWETANGLNINSAADGPTLHASGYSNLEMYLAGPSTETTPVLSNLLPTSNLARTATSATLQATTDQTATCRYALGSGTPYAGMTPFTSTANTAHSSSVSVVAGGVYQYCVRCMGTSLVSDESCTRFAVDPNPKKRVLH